MEPRFDLQQQVQDAFMNDEDMRGFSIEVLNSNGVITLRGTVPSVHARERAESVARTMPGVTSVINELDVV